jgi:hypothetical protein
MKKIILVLTTILLSISQVIYAQEKKHFSVGVNINQVQNDFGLGLHTTSPYFANNSVAVKLGANIQWLQHIDKNETIWSPYYNIQLGFRSRHPIIKDRLSVYAEGGTVLLFPNAIFSNKRTIFGGYGLLGLEFSANKKIGYFIELGGMGTGALADKIPTKPIYSNGFTSSFGIRFIL